MVTELDKLKRAKDYLQKLAKGIDPIADTKLPSDTALSNPRLSRCFTYVAEVLQKVIDNGGQIGGWQKPFFITADEVRKVTLSDQPVSISLFVKAVNDAVNDASRKKLTHTTLTKWLVEQGYLRVVQDDGKKSHKEPTEKSFEIGVSSEERSGQNGAYTAILYDKQAQQFMLDNLISITGAQ